MRVLSNSRMGFTKLLLSERQHMSLTISSGWGGSVKNLALPVLNVSIPVDFTSQSVSCRVVTSAKIP